MWSPERGLCRSKTWRTALLIAAAGLAATAGCTVQPLYSAAPAAVNGGTTASIGADLSTVAIKPVGERVGQEVRNQLIFLFGGGKGQPAAPRYSLDLVVSSYSEATANIQVNRENEPTAAILTVIARYRLTDTQGNPFSNGKRQFVASYDVPRQEFAALRAKRDAENRAAREVAELIRLAIAQDLARGPQLPEQADTRSGKKALFSLDCEDACSPSQTN
jgi:LPS-assembly lipoprotein